MLVDFDRRCPVSKKCRELSHQYKGGDLQLKIAQHTADEWAKLYAYKPMMVSMPKIHTSYMVMTRDQQSKFNKDNPDWKDGEEMKRYDRDKNQIRIDNDSNKYHLTETIRILKKDPVRKSKLERVLSKHEGAKVGVPSVNWSD